MPTYQFNAPGDSYLATRNHTVIPILTGGQLTSGAITGNVSLAGESETGKSAQGIYQSGAGIETSGNGPVALINSFVQGTAIAGLFWTDDQHSGNSGPCGDMTPPNGCSQQVIEGNLTRYRNTVTTHPCYLYTSPCYNGGEYYWRNIGENKAGRFTSEVGNKYGPFSSQTGKGQCGLHEAFSGPAFPGAPSYVDSSDWLFTDNSCFSMSMVGISTAFGFQTNGTNTSLPTSRILVENNLFYNDNGWAANGPQPYGSGTTNVNDGGNSCPYGYLFGFGAPGQDITIRHNTVFGQGGCFSMFWFAGMQPGGLTITDNVLNLVSDPWPLYASFTLGTGTEYLGYNLTGAYPNVFDSCQGQQGSALFTGGTGDCRALQNFTWAGNVMLATWKNSNPTSLVEYGSGDLAALIAGLPTSYWPSASTLAGRAASMQWNNYATGNFRITGGPYQSRASASSDGKDIGVDMDRLASVQGDVSNVHTFAATATSVNIGFLAPDTTFACGVDWSTTNFVAGTGTWTRVAGTAGSRQQTVALTGLPSDALIYYRINCATMQPTGSVQLP
jgi:hypothetical protein